GLPICKALVEMHGGTIGVRSEPGKGAEFIFTLPRITARRALVDHVTRLIERARREEQHVGLLGLLLRGTGNGGGRDPLLFERVRTVIEKGLYKAQDRIFGRDSRALILVLPESDAAGLGAVAKRLDGMLRKELGERYETARFRWRMAVYPAHAHTARDLLRALSRGREDPLSMEAGPAA
ncbi:MAG: ATP-binding protein, partial [Deltaproteobacteria bacterium]|nr:ATP-binding protein [Deltaproteobacteria bacterium]